MLKQQLSGTETGWWFVCHNGKMWLPKGNIPYGSAAQWKLEGEYTKQIGEWLGKPVWLICKMMANEMLGIRPLLSQDPKLFQLAGRAVQLALFLHSHTFCGYCGGKMHLSHHEWVCICNDCQQRYYPQIAPSIIVAIRRQDSILLAQHCKHRNGIFTVLAGFTEAGETLEQTAYREVMEESGIEITNLRYVSSQPWPFPHSLMVGYLADYKSGTIQIDPSELVYANWYRYDQLPKQLPEVGTIARRRIEYTVALCRLEYESK